MNNIIYIVGLIVVVLFVLSLLGVTKNYNDSRKAFESRQAKTLGMSVAT